MRRNLRPFEETTLLGSKQLLQYLLVTKRRFGHVWMFYDVHVTDLIRKNQCSHVNACYIGYDS